MYLLDTHALLWFVNTDQRLSNQARSLISNGNNDRYLSIASLWEIAIKINLGKLTLGMSLADLRAHHIDANGIQLLPLRTNALDTYTTLPLHRRDPFDRLIIAQAVTEHLSIITRDAHFSAYPITIEW